MLSHGLLGLKAMWAFSATKLTLLGRHYWSTFVADKSDSESSFSVSLNNSMFIEIFKFFNFYVFQFSDANTNQANPVLQSMSDCFQISRARTPLHLS